MSGSDSLITSSSGRGCPSSSFFLLPADGGTKDLGPLVSAPSALHLGRLAVCQQRPPQTQSRGRAHKWGWTVTTQQSLKEPHSCWDSVLPHKALTPPGASRARDKWLLPHNPRFQPVELFGSLIKWDTTEPGIGWGYPVTSSFLCLHPEAATSPQGEGKPVCDPAGLMPPQTLRGISTISS